MRSCTCVERLRAPEQGRGTAVHATPDSGDFLPLPHPPPPQTTPQGKCQPPLPGQGAVGVGSLGTSPAHPSSGPPSRLHFTVKMQSIPAILITGCCISQQSAHTKEQQTQKMIFQQAFSLSLLFLHNQLSITGSQARYVQSLSEFVDVTSRSFFLYILEAEAVSNTLKRFGCCWPYSYLTC